MIRIAIVGSRTYPQLDLVAACVGRLAAWGDARGEPVVIVSGTEPKEGKPPGVDETAIAAARRLGLETVVHAPDWSRGKGAGLSRNSTIVADSDHVVAFWSPDAEGNWSRGSADSIRKSLGRGNLRRVYGPDGEVLSFDVVGELLRQTLGG